MNERDEIAQMILDATYQPTWGECVRAADFLIAAGYRKHPEPERVRAEQREIDALIAEASDLIAYHLREQEFDPRYRDRTPAEQAELIGRLVAALRKHPEPEWEYRTTVGGHDPQPHGRLNRGETTVSEVLAGFADDERPLVLERRIKAGPWEPVG